MDGQSPGLTEALAALLALEGLLFGVDVPVKEVLVSVKQVQWFFYDLSMTTEPEPDNQTARVRVSQQVGWDPRAGRKLF